MGAYSASPQAGAVFPWGRLSRREIILLGELRDSSERSERARDKIFKIFSRPVGDSLEHAERAEGRKKQRAARDEAGSGKRGDS